MLLDLCGKNEGNPFSTKIWVVGSYTDTLLSGTMIKFLPLDFLSVSHSHIQFHERINTLFTVCKVKVFKFEKRTGDMFRF